jgi:hypothetical protein
VIRKKQEKNSSNKHDENDSSQDAGARGIGPTGFFGGKGGSSTPIPEDLRGGPPERPDEACGSGSCSHSLNS